MSTEATPHYPGRALIDAYGNGGFRFAHMSHQGSLLIIASGIYAWDQSDAGSLRPDDFATVFGEAADLELLLLGTGQTQLFPAPEIKSAFADAGIGLEVMSTGAACRTYNILLAEGRDVAAALIAVP